MMRLSSFCSARRTRRWLLRSLSSSAAARSSNSSGISAEQEELIYTRGHADRDLYHPAFAVRLLEGKGRGVVARAPVELGDLLTWSRAAAALTGPLHEQPDAGGLGAPLLALRADALTWGAHAGLEYLSDGTEAAAARVPPPFWEEQQGASPGHSSSSSRSSSSNPPAQWPPSPDVLAWMVRLNAFGDGYEDLASAAIRTNSSTSTSSSTSSSSAGNSIVGLWPALAYFNHSCLPSTVHYALGDAGLVVRAVSDAEPGSELTVSYLGREEFAPVEARRRVLKERWGFDCACERCRVDAAAPRELARAVTDAHARVAHELRPAFLSAIAAGDVGKLALAARALREVDGNVRAAIKQHARAPGVHPATATFAHAALYDLYELLCAAAQLELGASSDEGSESSSSENNSSSSESAGERGQELLAAMARCLSIVDAVSRGAELHVFLAAALHKRAAALRGPASPQAQAALQLAGQAAEARYGKQLSAKTWDALAAANAALADEYL